MARPFSPTERSGQRLVSLREPFGLFVPALQHPQLRELGRSVNAAGTAPAFGQLAKRAGQLTFGRLQVSAAALAYLRFRRAAAGRSVKPYSMPTRLKSTATAVRDGLLELSRRAAADLATTLPGCRPAVA